jgi:hypothetical protein
MLDVRRRRRSVFAAGPHVRFTAQVRLASPTIAAKIFFFPVIRGAGPARTSTPEGDAMRVVDAHVDILKHGDRGVTIRGPSAASGIRSTSIVGDEARTDPPAAPRGLLASPRDRG